MLLRSTVSALLAAALMTAAAHAQMPVDSGHAALNGLDLYYEIHGEGEPLVMLHGGVNPAEMFGAPLAAMAQHARVIAVHLQAHGRTADIDRPLTFEAMADDVALLLEHLGIARASVMGYSLGAGVALQMAIRHPDAVDRLIAVSVPFSDAGFFPEVRAAFAQMPANAAMIAANVSQSPLATMYPDVDWASLFRKIGELNAAGWDWSDAVRGIDAPTLLVFADADAVRPDHIAQFYGLLGGGRRDAGLDGSGRVVHRLAIVPGTTHYNMLGSSSVTQHALDFLRR